MHIGHAFQYGGGISMLEPFWLVLGLRDVCDFHNIYF